MERRSCGCPIPGWGFGQPHLVGGFPVAGVGAGGALRSLPTQTTLGFCDSMRPKGISTPKPTDHGAQGITPPCRVSPSRDSIPSPLPFGLESKSSPGQPQAPTYQNTSLGGQVLALAVLPAWAAGGGGVAQQQPQHHRQAAAQRTPHPTGKEWAPKLQRSYRKKKEKKKK